MHFSISAGPCLWLFEGPSNARPGPISHLRSLPGPGLPAHVALLQKAARSYRWSVLLLALSATLREGIESVLFLTGVSQVGCGGVASMPA